MSDSPIDTSLPPEERLDPGPNPMQAPIRVEYGFRNPETGAVVVPANGGPALSWRKTARSDRKVLYQLFTDLKTNEDVWLPVPTLDE